MVPSKHDKVKVSKSVSQVQRRGEERSIPFHSVFGQPAEKEALDGQTDRQVASVLLFKEGMSVGSVY